jgi:hypothetical protein
MPARSNEFEQFAEKVASERKPRPQRLKPYLKWCSYRSGEPLRHPKSSATPNFFRSLPGTRFQSAGEFLEPRLAARKKFQYSRTGWLAGLRQRPREAAQVFLPSNLKDDS